MQPKTVPPQLMKSDISRGCLGVVNSIWPVNKFFSNDSKVFLGRKRHLA